jgi:acyl carrier protein
MTSVIGAWGDSNSPDDTKLCGEVIRYRRTNRQMTKEEFLIEMDELLEVEPGTLKGPERLKDLDQWTSLTIVSFMALSDSSNGVRVSPVDIAKCVTVSDLLRLAKVEPVNA